MHLDHDHDDLEANEIDFSKKKQSRNNDHQDGVKFENEAYL